MAHITITIVGIFFFLNIPRVFMGAYEVSQMHLVLHCTRYNSEWHPRMWYYRLDNISRFLMVLNSSTNFLIYCIKNSQFKVKYCNTKIRHQETRLTGIFQSCCSHVYLLNSMLNLITFLLC